MTGALSLSDIDNLTDGRIGRFDVACPICGPDRRSPINQRRPVLRIWRLEPNFATFNCERCNIEGYAVDRATERADPDIIARARARAQERQQIEAAEGQNKARWLWSQRQPIIGSIAENYLRECRGYQGLLPGTLGFLPAHGEHPPAMIAAFGMARETLPGELVMDDGAVRGVHLTKLKPDGSGKAGTDKDKIMIGRSIGFPIVVAPIDDGMGLAIAEGIEDALSLHEATGLGSWAAGSASRLPALAERIPSYVETVSIAADDDDAGLENANRLGQIVLRSRECRILVPS